MSNALLVSRLGGRVATALRADGDIVELRVEEPAEGLAAGQVVKGRVTTVLPGIQAAFLDVGAGPDAFLHAADLLLPGESPPEDVEDGSVEGDKDDDAAAPLRTLRRNAPAGPPIQDRLKEGRELVVQVARESLGGKGPRVTSVITLPGRYLVYAPQLAIRGVSRRIVEPSERERLRGIVRSLPPPSGGFIVRTAGTGASAEAFAADAAQLHATWCGIEARASRLPAPTLLHTDEGLFLRALRDAPREGWDQIVTDSMDLFDAGRAYLRDVDPELAARLRLDEGPSPLFDREGVHAEVERALRRRIWLRSGGTIVIEPTEALVSIDVNTGKNVGSSRFEDTVLHTNLEAAREIARQLRLRDLGGIIVIDFIDMDRSEHRRQVVDALSEALRGDRARTRVLGLSELGLLQLTRKRTREGLESALTRTCPACGGSGRLKSAETVAHEAVLEARRVISGLSVETVTVRAHPEVTRALRLALQNAGSGQVGAIAEHVRVEDDPEIDPGRFDVTAG